MDFLQSVKEKVGKTAKTAMQKSNELLESTKLSLKCNELQAEVEKKLQQIGQMVYDAQQGEGELSEDIQSLCEEIAATKREIEDLEENIARLKRQKRCSQCGGKMAEDAKFCPECGAKAL